MTDPLLIFIALALTLAGFVKGALGLGLPTISVGLLAIAMPPGWALAIVIVPAVITNIWQTFAGPYLRDIAKRLWPLMAGTAIGISLNAGALSHGSTRYGNVALGVLLTVYATLGLTRLAFKVARPHEKWVGGIVGLLTGLISAATGVQVVPSVPYMQAIGLEKDELVQALGVFFTVATLTLAFNLTNSGLLSTAIALPGTVAMISAFLGMAMGQAARARLPAEAFRRVFLIAMVLLGLYLAGSALIELTW